MSVFLTKSLWVVAVVVLSGCTLTPDYQRPVAPIPAAWPAAFAGEQQGGSAASIAWQDFVRNDEARELVHLALENNRDLKTALLDIEAARAQYRIQRADRYPFIDGQASGQRQRVPADIGSPGQDRISDRYEVGLGLTAFELDLFGRLRSLSEAALQEYLATEEVARAVRISLIVSVLESYVVADGALKRRLLTQETLQTRQISLNLISQRRSQGVASALDYQDAIALTEEARAELERTDREFQRARNALAMLVGNTVDRDAILTAPASGSIISDQVHAGLPAELLQRRPDILAAERRLMARNADIGAARAAFFPRLSLTGSYGSASSDLSGLFEAGSGAWTFAPRIDLPIFRGGQNRASLDLASVRRDRAVVAYERTIQTAFREVVDALDGRETLAREAQARRALAAASTQALTLAEARYKQGVDGFLRYLDSQRSSFADRVGAIDAATEHDVAVVQLFGAVGGDWSAASEL
ncbi:efflux transporter outer membrane subunit [Bordetella tumulicola]|uniref:efflux transporter outer membrane subunit n=1 Tax=Bordetella tumulicola TaxID=1649133 RepID=UPI0039F0A1E8